MKPLTAVATVLLLIAIAATPAGAACNQSGVFDLPAWQPNPPEDNVSFYRVYRATAVNGVYIPVGTTPAPGYTDDVTSAGYGTYFYKTTAVTICEGAEIESELSDPCPEEFIFAKTPAKPTW